MSFSTNDLDTLERALWPNINSSGGDHVGYRARVAIAALRERVAKLERTLIDANERIKARPGIVIDMATEDRADFERQLAKANARAERIPREPTEAMIAAAGETWSHATFNEDIRAIWRAMYDTALEAQGKGGTK